MATDFNQVSQELAQDMELLRNSVQRGTSGLNQIGGVSESTVAKVKSFGNGLEQTTSTFLKSVYSGGSALEAMAATTQSATSSVAGLAKEFGIVGKIFGYVIEKLGFIASQGITDLNKAFKAYGDLSRSGATGARGMTEFVEQAAKLGYSVDTLNQFTALIGRSSTLLSTFGDGVSDSVNKIAKISDEFTTSGFRGELFAMGYQLEDVNDGIVKYARLLSITGQQDRMRGQDLTAGAKAYIKELDLLTKLTGKNAETIQSEREARLLEERYLAATLQSQQEEDELRRQGRVAEAEVIKAQRENKQKLLDIIPKSLQTEFGALFEGIITGPQMASLMQAMPETVRYIQSGGRDMVEFSRMVNSELAAFTGKGGIGNSVALVGQFNQAFGIAFSDLVETMRNTSKILKGETVKTATGDQTITDRLTRAVAHLEDGFLLAQQALQDFVRKGVTPVVELVSEQVQKLKQYENERFMPTRIPPYPFGPPPAAAPPRLPGGAVPPTQDGTPAETVPPGEAEAVAPGTYTPPPPVAPAAPAAPAAPVQRPGVYRPTGQQQDPLAGLNFGGLRAERTGGGEASPTLIAKARQVMQMFGPETVITALNDVFHRERYPNSSHVKGLAMDFALGPAQRPKDRQEAAAMKQTLTELGLINVRDEYFADVTNATSGPHFHAEVSARFGRLTSGPLSGYRATLHGNEVVIPLSNGTTIPLDMTPLIRNLDSNAQALSAQIQRLDDLIMLSRDTLNVNRKMLSYRT
jgi:hypothetical protein